MKEKGGKKEEEEDNNMSHYEKQKLLQLSDAGTINISTYLCPASLIMLSQNFFE